MYKIERTSYGLHLTLDGEVTVAEATQIKTEVAVLFPVLKKPFGVVADIRTLIPVSPEVKKLLEECEQMSRAAGLQRRAVIFSSPVVKSQAAQLSFLSKTDQAERRIDASRTDDWERIALAWVVDNVEPESAPVSQSRSGALRT